jgi:hypothetical protein
MNSDLYAVSGTSPTAVQQTDYPTKSPQDESFFPSNFHVVPTESLKCDKSQFRPVRHV